MSRDIDVVPFRDISVRSLLDRCGRVAAVALNLPRGVELDVRRITRGSEVPMGPDEILSIRESCVVGFLGELPACITTFLVPLHTGMAPEDSPHAGVSVFGRSPARFVMAPIVAIAIADLVGGTLLGESNLGDWAEGVPAEARVSPAQFLAAIRLTEPQPTLRAAIHVFCSRTKAGREHLG